MKNCFDGYLTPECENCPYWADGSDDNKGIGCATPYPIMSCKAFAKMWEKEAKETVCEVEPDFDPTHGLEYLGW